MAALTRVEPGDPLLVHRLAPEQLAESAVQTAYAPVVFSWQVGERRGKSFVGTAAQFRSYNPSSPSQTMDPRPPGLDKPRPHLLQ